MKIDVSIVTINFNSSAHTIRFVDSVRKYCTLSYEIIVVDNGSDYENTRMLDCFEEFDDVRVIFTGRNNGFALGNKIGADLAFGDYIFLVNNDTVFLNDVASALMSEMKKNDDIGLITPQLYSEDGSPQRSFREFPTVTEKFFGKMVRNALSRRKIHNNKALYKELIDVGVVSGCAMFFDAEVYRALGGLDIRFFLYCEEEDISKRVHEFGKRVCLCPTGKLIHFEGGSTNRRYEIEREFLISYFYLVNKHCNVFSALLLKFYMALKYLKKSVGSEQSRRLFLFCFSRSKFDFSLRNSN